MKKSLLLISGMVMLLRVTAQSEAGAEQYVSYTPSSSVVGHSSIIYFQSSGKWHGELRYNYDEIGTASINAGRVFSFGGKVNTSLKPMVGLVIGSFSGVSLNLDHEVEWNRLYYSSQMQYMISFHSAAQNFFYAWFESGYYLSKNIFAGISFQAVLSAQPFQYFNKGVMIGFSSGKWSFPVYFFDPLSPGRNITTGLFYNVSFKGK